MKIKLSTLRQVIKEEVQRALTEVTGNCESTFVSPKSGETVQCTLPLGHDAASDDLHYNDVADIEWSDEESVTGGPVTGSGEEYDNPNDPMFATGRRVNW